MNAKIADLDKNSVGRHIPSLYRHDRADLALLSRLQVYVPADGDKHTSVFGNVPVDNLDTSMRAGTRGPTSIADPVARERISHFDHER